MKLLLASIFSAMLFVGGPATTLAQTAATAPVTAASCPAGTTFVKAYTKKSGTEVAAHCKKGKSSGAMSAASPVSAASAAPAMAGASPSSKKHKSTASPSAMGTPAAKSTPIAAAGSAAMTCPPGKSYVKGYTKQNGTKVAGYCRKTPEKKS